MEDEFGAVYRFRNTGSPRRIRANWSGGLVSYQFRITAVISGTHVLVEPSGRTFVHPEHIVETHHWALGSFGGVRGWLAVGAFHQERLILASTPAEPTTIWMSRPASWHDFGVSFPARDDPVGTYPGEPGGPPAQGKRIKFSKALLQLN